MSENVREVSREELLSERRRLLDSIGMTRDEIEEMAACGRLSGAQFWVYEDIRSVEFLLGDSLVDG